MRIITFEKDNERQVGVWNGDKDIIPIKMCGVNFESVNDLIVNSKKEDLVTLKDAFKKHSDKIINIDAVRLLAPIPNPLQDVLCLGLNYVEHAKEAADYSKEAFTSEKENAIYFSKRVNEAVPHMGKISAHQELTQKLDYEVELAVILAKDAKDVAPNEVKDYIFGYTIINDMSARDLQTAHKQWYFGKSLDDFLPMGPCILTADEVSYPPALSISSEVNGVKRQDGNTSMFIHDIDEVVSELSKGMTLKRGTIIATGTPKGVGMGMEKPEFLKKGDVITCYIEKIGKLTNVIE